MERSLLERAIKTMLHTNRMHRQLIDGCAAVTGLGRTPHMMLMHLARREKCPSQRELAEELAITPAAVTGVLKNLERDGYITREVGRDTRYNVIAITERGREVVESSRRQFRAADESVFAGFSDEELKTYISILERMEENMKGAAK